MLLPVGPLPGVLASIRPANLSIAVLLVISVASSVDFAAVRPIENSLSMHLVISPFPCVGARISPGVCAQSFDVVVPELAFVLRIVSPYEKTTVSMLLASYVGTLVKRPVRPCLKSIAMLPICHPVPFVGCAVRIAIISIAVRFAINPIPRIDVTT